MKRLLILTAALVLGFSPRAQAAMFGYEFDDNAFSDNAVLVSGEVDYWGFGKWGYPITGDDSIDLPVALNGSDLYTLIEGVRRNETYYNYTVEVLFDDNFLYNGPGSDLVLWERGSSAEPMDVSPYDPETGQWLDYRTFTPWRLGFLEDSVDVTGGVNAAEVDLSLWSLSVNTRIQKLRISTEQWTGTSRTSADLAAIGGLHSSGVTQVIPEPSSLLLLGSGFLGFAGIRLRRIRRSC